MADRANGGIKQIQSKLTATKSRYHQWALRYNLICPDLDEAVVLAAIADHLELSVRPTPAHVIRGVLSDHDEPIVLAEYLDRHGTPVHSRPPTFTEVLGGHFRD